MLGVCARKLPLFTGADPSRTGQRRGSSSSGELAPGGCALTQRRPFPTASLWGNTGAPGSLVLQFPMSLLSGPLAVCRALVWMLWKQSSELYARPCSLGLVRKNSESPGGSIRTELFVC